MPPRLSIVVPVYNVELYLDECLESIAAQTFDDFEVVIVDDGSTDASAVIAKNFAERDQRFRVVLQKNAGLGAARNVGFRHLAEGTEYVAFVDSDDTMPPYAYEKLIAALDQTGSDFAGGNVRRFRSVGMQQSWGHRIAFANTRLKTHISKFPALVTDRTAWNKVYRRSFWEEHGFAYPEGILYEDAPVSIPAHYFAKSVDVIGDVVYHWRVRETGERSITQRATDPVSLTDRVTSVRLVREALLGKQGEKYARYLRDYDRNVLSEELPLIYKYVGEAGPEFRAAFVKEVGGLIREIGTEPWNDLTVADRLKAYLAREGRVEEFIALVRHQKDFTYSVPVKGLARPQADYPFLKAPVPAKLLTLGPRERRVVSRLEQAAWSDGKLLLRGYALPGHMGAESRLGSRKMLIFRENGKRLAHRRQHPHRRLPDGHGQQPAPRPAARGLGRLQRRRRPHRLPVGRQVARGHMVHLHRRHRRRRPAPRPPQGRRTRQRTHPAGVLGHPRRPHPADRLRSLHRPGRDRPRPGPGRPPRRRRRPGTDRRARRRGRR
ncbi:Undecaprenyl-phosphate 4-deoxy-4-formamido-L-arabinose transferase [Streptomyces lavendulae subsp. lavendulae]